MGKLNIAHHKSYHPYRRDNIERVRRDEEEARRKEEGEEGRMRVADSEARLDLLRERSGGKKKELKDSERNDTNTVAPLTSISTSSGHINLFADFEQHATLNALARTKELTSKNAKAEEEKGVRLAPSAKDLKPWYTDGERKEGELSEDKRLKDISSKSLVDPLTSIRSELSRSFPASQPTPPSRRIQTPVNTTEGRLQREASERTRAMELIRRKKRERERDALGLANMTPSSVGGDDLDRNTGYGDVYNRKETEEAHRRRDHGWGRERERKRYEEWEKDDKNGRDHRYWARRW